MSYPTLTFRNQRKRTSLPILDLVFDFVDWVVEKPERGIAIGIITMFLGLGIVTVSASLKGHCR
jgi:hypothetical protein